MNRTIVKSMLRAAGFTGRIHFRKVDKFGTPDEFGPAIHRRWIDPVFEVEEIMHSVERDFFTQVVIYLEPKSYYKYLNLLSDPKHVWTESEINGLRKGLGFCSTWSRPAKAELCQTIMRNTYNFRITREQTEFGIEWLRSTQFNRHGRLRASKRCFIGDFEASVIRTFKRFEFLGLRFQDYNHYTECYQTIAPIYRVVSKNGRWFDYSTTAFGGQEVIGQGGAE